MAAEERVRREAIECECELMFEFEGGIECGRGFEGKRL